jgi:hypothetical protein
VVFGNTRQRRYALGFRGPGRELLSRGCAVFGNGHTDKGRKDRSGSKPV